MVIGITRDEGGKVVVVVDHGDHRTRVTWMALVKAALTRKPAPINDVIDQHPAPVLAELPDEYRAVISKRYRDLCRSKQGRSEGTPRPTVVRASSTPNMTPRPPPRLSGSSRRVANSRRSARWERPEPRCTVRSVASAKGPTS